jgi:hypothetical protein
MFDTKFLPPVNRLRGVGELSQVSKSGHHTRGVFVGRSGTVETLEKNFRNRFSMGALADDAAVINTQPHH